MKTEQSEEKILIKTKDKKNFQVSAKFLVSCPKASKAFSIFDKFKKFWQKFFKIKLGWIFIDE